ncbi:MAG: nucleotide exchange factor GrpE [Planctomycetes bacterium]|nr:nucleotide exchange factor GrpE [Planctomycetota bacterium]
MDNWPDHEEILTRCQDWLRQTRSQCDSLDGHAADEQRPDEPVGLYQLVEQFTALRHDMKLLTKATRGTEERNEATLLSLQAAIEQFRGVESKEEEAADKAARPLAEALVELDESLVRCRSVIEQTKHRVLKDVNAELKAGRDRLDELFRTQPWWRRRLCRPWHEAARALFSGHAADTYRNIFDSLLEGHDLIENRLRRTMEQRSIVRIQCLGEQADPHRMTVVEVVSDLTRRPGTVIEEVRPGYCWKRQVLRFAEVKAVGEQ